MRADGRLSVEIVMLIVRPDDVLDPRQVVGHPRVDPRGIGEAAVPAEGRHAHLGLQALVRLLDHQGSTRIALKPSRFFKLFNWIAFLSIQPSSTKSLSSKTAVEAYSRLHSRPQQHPLMQPLVTETW